MNLFHQIEGESVILRSNGVFTQTTLFERNGELFAKKGSGFVRLLDMEKTSHPSTFWEAISVATTVGKFGRLKR